MHQNDRLGVKKKGFNADANRRKKIIIVGAGVAGLVTGDLLKRAGHKITIRSLNHYFELL